MPGFDDNHDAINPDPEVPVSSGDSRKDPRLRPADPAGTRPRVDPASLLPSSTEPLLRAPAAADIDTVGVEVPLDEDETTGGDLLPTRRPADSPALPSFPAATPPHAGRFGFALGALMAIAAAGVLVAVLAITQNQADNSPTGPRWSAWAPSRNGGDDRSQIASHVARQYRLPTGRQLVLVTGGPLKVSDVNLDIAKVGASKKAGIKVVKGDKTVMFRMCGLATACSIPGKPSTSRGFLVRREALELALYTFRYTDANGVVVVLPPALVLKRGQRTPTAADIQKANQSRLAAYFPRDELEKRVEDPLAATLSPRTPSIANATRSPDAPTVKGFTTPAIYTFGLTSGNTQDKGYLVLQK